MGSLTLNLSQVKDLRNLVDVFEVAKAVGDDSQGQ